MGEGVIWVEGRQIFFHRLPERRRSKHRIHAIEGFDLGSARTDSDSLASANGRTRQSQTLAKPQRRLDSRLCFGCHRLAVRLVARIEGVEKM